MKRLLSLILAIASIVGCSIVPVHVHAEPESDAITQEVITNSVPGDMNGDGVLESADSLYLLRYTLFAENYTLAVEGDVNGDGTISSDDAIYLLRHTLMPEEFPLHEHLFTDWVIIKDPTCKETGTSQGTCSCGKTETKEEAISENHTWDNGVTTKQPTCNEEGITTYTCTVCSETTTASIPTNDGHVWNNGEITKQPTCNEEGTTTYTCTLCGEGKTSPIAATQNHTWNSGEVTKPATYAENGVKTFTCSACSTTKTEAIIPTRLAKVTVSDPLSFVTSTDGLHLPVVNFVFTNKASAGLDCVWKVVLKSTGASQTAEGTVLVDGVSYTNKYEIGAAATQIGNRAKIGWHVDENGNHVASFIFPFTLAEIKAAGYSTFYEAACAGAFEAYVRDPSYGGSDGVIFDVIANTTIDGKDASLVNVTTVSDHVWTGKVTTQPTCAKEGVMTYTCSSCTETKTEAIAKLTTHTWNGGVVTKAATCKDTGVKTYTCTVCSTTKTETIAKTSNHTWNSGTVTKQPTADAEGVKTYTCTTCSATKTEAIAKLTVGFSATKITTDPNTGYWKVDLQITNPSDQFKEDAWIGIYPASVNENNLSSAQSLSTWTYAFFDRYTSGLSSSNARPAGTTFNTFISSHFFTGMGSGKEFTSAYPYGAVIGQSYKIVLFYNDSGYSKAACITVQLGTQTQNAVQNYGFGITSVTADAKTGTWSVKGFVENPTSSFWHDAWIGIYPTTVTQAQLYEKKGAAGLNTWKTIFSGSVASGRTTFELTQANTGGLGSDNIHLANYPNGPIIGDEFQLILFYSDGASGNGYTVARSIVFRLGQKAKQETIRVGSFNIKHAELVSLDYSKLGNQIKSYNLNLVGLQEVEMNTGRTQQHNQAQKMAEASGLKYYYFVRAIDYSGGYYGTAILSAFPIIGFVTKALPEINSSYEDRSLGHIAIKVNGIRMDFLNTHTSYESVAARAPQIEAIKNEIANTCDLGYTFLTGDFNTEGFSEFNVLTNMGMKLINNSSRKHVTDPNGNRSIDNIIYGPNFTEVSSGSVINGLSDHYMLWAEFKYNMPNY